MNIVILVIVTFFWGVSEVAPQAPRSARETAVAEIETLAKRLGKTRFHTVFNAQVTGVQLKKATLGTACLYLHNVDIDTLAVAGYRDLINHAESYWYTFPVIHNGRPIGEISVRENPARSGNYETSGRSSSGSAQLDRLMYVENL